MFEKAYIKNKNRLVYLSIKLIFPKIFYGFPFTYQNGKYFDMFLEFGTT